MKKLCIIKLEKEKHTPLILIFYNQDYTTHFTKKQYQKPNFHKTIAIKPSKKHPTSSYRVVERKRYNYFLFKRPTVPQDPQSVARGDGLPCKVPSLATTTLLWKVFK